MSELTSITRPDGKSCPAYLAEASAPKGAIVVVQEWWGLNPHIKKVADRFAAAGYTALVPDLYRGKIATDADEASHEMGALDFMAAAKQDIRGCVQHLKPIGKVAVGGFCMGGALTLLAAMHVEEVDAGVCFYGIPPAAAGDPSTIAIPMLLHFANTDDWCTPALIDDLEAKLKAGGVNHTLHRYDAEHAFMNEARPEVFDEACATQAWERTLSFLALSFQASALA
jgi:carboxymethylenebutenolidase